MSADFNLWPLSTYATNLFYPTQSGKEHSSLSTNQSSSHSKISSLSYGFLASTIILIAKIVDAVFVATPGYLWNQRPTFCLRSQVEIKPKATVEPRENPKNSQLPHVSANFPGVNSSGGGLPSSNSGAQLPSPVSHPIDPPIVPDVNSLGSNPSVSNLSPPLNPSSSAPSPSAVIVSAPPPNSEREIAKKAEALNRKFNQLKKAQKEAQEGLGFWETQRQSKQKTPNVKHYRNQLAEANAALEKFRQENPSFASR